MVLNACTVTGSIPFLVAILASAAIMLSREFIERQEPTLQAFLNAVMAGTDRVHDEGLRQMFVILFGAFITVLGFIMTMSLATYIPTLFGTMTAFTCAGVLVMVIGAVWWHSVIRRTSFRGYRRSWLPIALSYLDAKEAGVADVGEFLSFPRPPRQLVFLQTAGTGTSRALLRKMQLATSSSVYSTVEREAAKTENKFIGPMLLLIPLLLVLTFLSALSTPQMGPVAALVTVLCVLVLCQYLRNRTVLKRARSEAPAQTSTGPPEIVAEIIRLMRNEYSYPIRLMTVREHTEFMYTGRVFLTSTEVRFREAVFIPSNPP